MNHLARWMKLRGRLTIVISRLNSMYRGERKNSYHFFVITFFLLRRSDKQQMLLVCSKDFRFEGFFEVSPPKLVK